MQVILWVFILLAARKNNLFINLNCLKSLLINQFQFFKVKDVIKPSLNIIMHSVLFLFCAHSHKSHKWVVSKSLAFRLAMPALKALDALAALTSGGLLPLREGGDFNHNKNKLSKIKESFLQWFVGFSDAEGSFIYNIKNKTEVHFIFQITLHIDDVVTLYNIRENLDIGVVTIKGNTCSFRVHSFSILINYIIPIFDKYPLLTHKQLDYRDWKKAILLKKDNQEISRSLSSDTLKKINNIKSGINTSRAKAALTSGISKRENYEGYILNKNMIQKNWLLGFIEGHGSFYISNSSVVFGITQKDRKILDTISEFIQDLPLLPPYTNLFVPKKPNCIITSKNNNKAYQLVITDKDVLFQYIFPFFQNLKFYSRKKIDFIIWSTVLFLFMFGYNHTSKGKIVWLKLFNIMNSKRYFSNILDILDVIDLKDIFNIEPPFNIQSGKSHFILTKEYFQSKGSRLGFKLYIYKNGVEIIGSPFPSFTQGGKAINLNSVSSIRNYIDTGKIYKEGFTFYSAPHSPRLCS